MLTESTQIGKYTLNGRTLDVHPPGLAYDIVETSSGSTIAWMCVECIPGLGTDMCVVNRDALARGTIVDATMFPGTGEFWIYTSEGGFMRIGCKSAKWARAGFRDRMYYEEFHS